MSRRTILAAVFLCSVSNFGAVAQESPMMRYKVEMEATQLAGKDQAQTSGQSTEVSPGIDSLTTASIDSRVHRSLVPVATEPAAPAVAKAAPTVVAAKPAKAAAKPNVKVAKNQYSTIISSYAAAYGVPVALAHAVVGVESSFRANARGAAGEIGLMQIKPTTARMMGYSGSAKGLYDPDTNIKYGMKYLAKAHQLGGGDTCGTILRYNAGHGAKRMNKISAAYCAKVKRQIGS